MVEEHALSASFNSWLRGWITWIVLGSVSYLVVLVWLTRWWRRVEHHSPDNATLALLVSTVGVLTVGAVVMVPVVEASRGLEDVVSLGLMIQTVGLSGGNLLSLLFTYLYSEAEGLLGSRGRVARVVEAVCVTVGVLVLLWLGTASLEALLQRRLSLLHLHVFVGTLYTCYSLLRAILAVTSPTTRKILTIVLLLLLFLPLPGCLRILGTTIYTIMITRYELSFFQPSSVPLLLFFAFKCTLLSVVIVHNPLLSPTAYILLISLFV